MGTWHYFYEVQIKAHCKCGWLLREERTSEKHATAEGILASNFILISKNLKLHIPATKRNPL